MIYIICMITSTVYIHIDSSSVWDPAAAVGTWKKKTENKVNDQVTNDSWETTK